MILNVDVCNHRRMLLLSHCLEHILILPLSAQCPLQNQSCSLPMLGFIQLERFENCFKNVVNNWFAPCVTNLSNGCACIYLVTILLQICYFFAFSQLFSTKNAENDTTIVCRNHSQNSYWLNLLV